MCYEGDETKMIFGENVLESARTGLNLVNKMPEGNEAQRWGQMFGCFELACESIGYLQIQNRELGKVIRDLQQEIWELKRQVEIVSLNVEEDRVNK